MNILEKDIEDLICDTIEYDQQVLRDRGLKISADQKYRRQVRLGNYGIADLIGMAIWPETKTIDCTIYELKKDKVNADTLFQAMRYGKAIARMVEQNCKYRISFDYVLIGKEIDNRSDFCYSIDLIHNLRVYTYSLDIITGLKFTRQKGFKLIHENLPDPNFSISNLKNLISYGNF